MSEVKRYDVGTEYDCGVMDECKTGDYVEWDDYASLKEECDETKDRLIEMTLNAEKYGQEAVELQDQLDKLLEQCAELRRVQEAEIQKLKEQLNRSEDYCIGVDSERMDYIDKYNKVVAENG